MILKNADSKQNQIEVLQKLLLDVPETTKARITKELNILKAGIKGEEESAYHIDFNLRDTKNSIVIHDLRLEFNNRVAQIDHLIIHRTLNIYVVESKHFGSGININENGEFLQWSKFNRKFEGIPSPLAQNERHISVLNDIFKNLIDLPTRLGFTLCPKFHSLILLNNDARIERSSKFDSSKVIKSEQLLATLNKDMDGIGIGSLAKVISPETTKDVASQLLLFHRPIQIDYYAKFGIQKNEINPINEPKTLQPKTSNTPIEVKDNILINDSFKCKKCDGSSIKIQYGKFGYYFKCSDCEGNTNIKIGCTLDGHNEKLRKDGKQFFQECAECKTSKLYFEN